VLFKKYYCIKQYDITDCAAACLTTISKQYGLKIPITRIREVAGTDILYYYTFPHCILYYRF